MVTDPRTHTHTHKQTGPITIHCAAASLARSVKRKHIGTQLRFGRQRQVWLIPLADETQSVQVKLCYPLTMRAIPERLRDASCGGAIQINYLYLYIHELPYQTQKRW